MLADPSDDIVAENSQFAKDDYNTLDVYGARAALRVNLGENWTLTPQFMMQSTDQKGAWGSDLSGFTPGDYDVTRFTPEFYKDDWYQAGLTIEGRIGSLAPRFQMVQSEYSQRKTLTVDAPEVLRQFREDGVDVAVLTAI